MSEVIVTPPLPSPTPEPSLVNQPPTTVEGGGGNDTIVGGTGNDTVPGDTVEGATGNDTAPAVFVPLTAEDIKFPDGFTVIEPLRDEFLTLLNDQEMSGKDRAAGLIALQEKVLTSASEANSEAWNTVQTEWQTAVKADPEIGGAKFDATMVNVAKLVEEYGSPELRGAFDITGAGNNPHIIKFLNKIAGQLTEQGGPTPGTPTNQGDAASRMYPSMKG